uniref:Major facilitator superfamily (MFS) profile domain-containing protein n=1 Tax=Cucumis sativus TaxID=3659 RepID=A0A0A0LW38_CUCSA
MIGAIVSGKLADYIGRRGTMGFAEIFCLLGWFFIAFSKTAWWLDIGRMLVGFGMGVISFVVPVFIAEITPKELRGAFTTVHQLMICFGISLTWLIGAFVNWRALALIGRTPIPTYVILKLKMKMVEWEVIFHYPDYVTGSVPCVIQLVGLPFIPESPRWLKLDSLTPRTVDKKAKNDRKFDCEVALQRLRGASKDVSAEILEIQEYTELLKQLPEPSVLDLFERQYARSLIAGVGLMALQQFGGVNGIGFYVKSLFTTAGFSGNIGTIALAIIQILMTSLGVVLMDVSGRRPLLMISASGTCLGCFSVALSFLLKDLQLWLSGSPMLAFFGVLTFVGSFSLGMGAIPWVIMSEIFPINMKGLAGSLVTLVSWLGSWIVSYSFNFLLNWSSAGIFFIFSSICGFTVFFVAKFVPETKGRTLEEIQAAMNPLSTKS